MTKTKTTGRYFTSQCHPVALRALFAETQTNPTFCYAILRLLFSLEEEAFDTGSNAEALGSWL